MRRVNVGALQHANFVTIEASWGQEAVEQARTFCPDIIILDMNMPDQSGIVTLQQLRADPHAASIPVVFLTSTADFAERKEAEQLRASAYLFNPVALDTLGTVVEGSISRATDFRRRLRSANGVV